MKATFKILLLLCLGCVFFTQCEKETGIELIDIPDNAFLTALIELGVDSDGDGKISPAEAEAITYLDVRQKSISDLTGIEAFVNLDSLNCQTNNLASLDLSGNSALIWLLCDDNQLTNLNVTNCTELITLTCWFNNLTSLDISTNINLWRLQCKENQLASLDVSKNTALWELGCPDNQLTSLDVSNNLQLGSLNCARNQLTNLDFSNNSFSSLSCGENQLTQLDVTNSINLAHLHCSSNQLTSLDLSKNNSYLTRIYIEDMPTLYEVCVGEPSFPPEERVFYMDGSPNVFFTTECGKKESASMLEAIKNQLNT